MNLRPLVFRTASASLLRLLGVLAAGLVFALPPAWTAPTWVAGITEPITDVTLAFPTLGVVAARPLAEGAAVTQGQVVIELDKRIEELDVERRRLARDLARIELQRVKELAQRSSISVTQEETDKKQAEYEIAAVEHQLAIEMVQRRLLKSPLDGYVVQFFKDVGEKCEEQQPVVRLVDTRRCYFIGNVEARTGARLQPGQKLDLEIEVGANTLQLQGTVAYLSPVVDPSSGLLKFKVVFDNPGNQVRPGVIGRAQIP